MSILHQIHGKLYPAFSIHDLSVTQIFISEYKCKLIIHFRKVLLNKCVIKLETDPLFKKKKPVNYVYFQTVNNPLDTTADLLSFCITLFRNVNPVS